MSYKFRKDSRTDKQFADDLKKYHKKEAVYSEAYRLHLEADPYLSVECIENGVDPTGEVIHGNIDDEYDYIYNITDNAAEEDFQRKIEIKTAPEYLDKFFSFKVSSLKRCVKYGADLIVCKINSFWHMPLDHITPILEVFPHKIYYGFSPNDKAVRLLKEDVENYLIKSDWHEDARYYIKSNVNILK
jgi:hypothetical protein